MGLVSWNIVTLVNTRCSPKALILGSTVACSRAVPWFPVHCDLLKRIALCISRSKNCLLLQPLYLSANTHKQMHMKASIHASQCVRFASDPIHRLLLHIYNLPLLIMPAHSSDILCSIPAYWHSLWFFLYSSLYMYICNTPVPAYVCVSGACNTTFALTSSALCSCSMLALFLYSSFCPLRIARLLPLPLSPLLQLLRGCCTKLQQTASTLYRRCCCSFHCHRFVA